MEIYSAKPNPALSWEERYNRQLLLPEVGEEGQRRLQAARVLVVGVGGLGSPIALYLAAAGVGTLGLLDDDAVSISNLQRQVLYTEAEVGLPKVLRAAQHLHALNSSIEIHAHHARLTEVNAAEIIGHYDMVVDGCDNFATRYLISDTCAAQQKPYVYGSIVGLEGQVSTFAEGRTYRQLYPDEREMCAWTADRAVVGVTPAVVGSVEANEVLKLICGYGEPLIGKLWTIDLRTMNSYTLTY